MTSADIKKRPWTDVEKSEIAMVAQRQVAGDDSGIDYSDIPRLTEAQLASMVRRSRSQAQSRGERASRPTGAGVA